MKPNEESKLIKNNKSKNQENKKFFCSFLKNTKSNIIKWSILIILIALIIFTIICIIILYQIKKEPMKILLERIQQNKEYFSLPANESTKYSDLLLDEKKICLEVASFSNIFTGNNKPKDNPWEEFFNQPCGYTLNEVVKMKDVKIFKCECVCDMPDEKTIYSNTIMLNYHHKIQEKYMSIKNNIYKEVEKIWQNLFGNSTNVLGIFIRGTDYISIEPSGHSRQPSTKRLINDVIKMNKKNKYDFIFLGTEDNKIRNLFIKIFGKKLKYLIPKDKIVYNYDTGNYLTYNKNVFGNMNFSKIYLLSVIILSKCIDIISSRTSGAAGVFIISNGFRNKLVYYLGEY